MCFEIGPYGSDLAQNSVWHTNSASYVDLDRSRDRFISFLIDFDVQRPPKSLIFDFWKKGVQKKLGGPGGKAPRLPKRFMKEVNIYI